MFVSVGQLLEVIVKLRAATLPCALQHMPGWLVAELQLRSLMQHLAETGKVAAEILSQLYIV